MSTHAQLEVTHYNGKKYPFWVHMDGYPSGIIRRLPDGPMDFEDFRRQMYLEDQYEPTPDYYYEISLPDSTMSIYGSEYGEGQPWHRGALLFKGTFAEAKQKYGE